MGKFQTEAVFPTYLVTKQWEGTDLGKLNVNLERYIKLDRDEDPNGINRSNAAGCWHSRDKCLQRYGQAGRALYNMFGDTFTKLAQAYGLAEGAEVSLKISAWTMIYGEGHYASVHCHPNCTFSGVYYVDAGPEPQELPQATGVTRKSGDLEFVDTRGNGGHQVLGLRLLPDAKVHAKTGLMIAFPQWLPHYVHPVRGDGERIAIACNATVTKLTPPKPKE